MTALNQPYPYPMIIIGMLERIVQNTGINPKINTIKESVKINGKVPSPTKPPIMSNPITVSTAFTRAIIDWALKIAPKPRLIFSAITAYSLYRKRKFPACINRKNRCTFSLSMMNI